MSGSSIISPNSVSSGHSTRSRNVDDVNTFEILREDIFSDDSNKVDEDDANGVVGLSLKENCESGG